MSRKSKLLHLTDGSRKATKPVSPSTKAKINDTTAATIKILTSKSSNCFRTNFQKGVPENNRGLDVVLLYIVNQINTTEFQKLTHIIF